MLARTPLVASIVLLTTLSQPARAAQTDAWSKRADLESRAILQGLITTEVETLRPCVFSDQWERLRPVGAAYARKHLGLNLRADVLAPEDGRRPNEIIDPAKAMKESFCSEEDSEKERKQAFADFSDGTIDGDEGAHGQTSGQISRQRIEFSRPVFDSTFRTALLIVTYSTLTRVRNVDGAKQRPDIYLPNGILKRNRLDFSAIRYLFRKYGKTWRKISANWEAATE